MTTDLVTPPRRKRRKAPNDEEVPRLVTKNVVVLRRGQVDKMGDTVMMPHTTIDMSNIKRKGQSKKINFEGSERSEDIGKKLVQTFDFLAGKRFYCAKAAKGRSHLDFDGNRRIWSLKEICDNLEGNSALYVFCEEENNDQHPSLIDQVENMQISRYESSSEDHTDSGFETLDIPEDPSRHRNPLLSSTIEPSSPESDKYRPNRDVEWSYSISEELKRNFSDYSETENLIEAIDAFELLPIHHGSESEETMHDTLSRNSQNNAGVEETNQYVAQEISHPQVEGDEPNHIFEQEQFDHGSESEETMQDTLSRNFKSNAGVEETSQDVAQEISHPQVEGDEPNHIFEQEQSHPQMDVEEPNQNVEQEQLVQKICPSSGPLEGGTDFLISLKEELPEHIQYRYAYFGNEQVALTKLNKLTLEGTTPAAQEPGVVKVRVYSDTDEFLGAADFEYKVTFNTVVCQVLQHLSELFALIRNHKRSSENQSSSAKQNSGQATGALNDSCQDRSSPEENTVMDDEYEDVVQHFQDLGKWLSEQSFYPIQSNTDMWLKLSNAFDGLCRKLACSEDEENFKGNQQTCPQEREENYFADAENSSCMSSEDDSASLSDPDNWSETFSACTEAEEDLEGDQLSCTQERDENYFPNTEDYSSVSYETGSALSNSESWDESLKDSSLSFPLVNSRSDKSLETIPEIESTQHSYKAANSKPDVSHEILAPMTEGFTSEDSIGNSHYVRSGVCLKWNTSFSESKKTKENSEKDDHNEKQDSSEEWASDRRTSHTWLASHDDTPVRFLDVPTLNVENEESQYQDDELLETLHTNAKPQSSKSIRSATSNQQSATHPGPITQEAAQSPLSNPLWNGDSKLNMALPQCGDEEIHSVIEGEGLASWFDFCENENAGKNERSRWEMSSIEPNKTDGGVEKDVFDSEEDLSQEQGLFSEQGNSHVHLSLPDDTSVQSRRPEVENEEIQDTPLCEAAGNGHTDIVRLLIENGADVNKRGSGTPLCKAAGNGHTDIVRLLIENGADVNKGEWGTPLCKAAENGHTDIVRLLIENGADINKGEWFTPLCEAAGNGHTDIVRLLIENGAEVNKSGSDTLLFQATRNGHTDIVRLLMVKGADVNKEDLFCGCPPLYGAARNGHTDIARLLIENGANVNIAGWFNIIYELPVEMLRRKFEADARDTKLSLERELDIQLRGKKTASLPKRLGNKLKTQTEMTSPRDIVEEGKCGKDRMTDVELGLNCLHLSPRCVQFKPCIMEESPGDSSIMHHDFKTINKRMDSVTLTDVGNAKQDYCVVVEKAKTHPSGDTIIIYGRKINEEGSGVGEAFRLATKDLKHTWDDEEVIAENVQIGSVVKYVRVGDEFLFQGNTKRSRWDGCYIWENEQLRHRSTTQGSLITFKRRPSWGFINSCYAGNTGKSLDINTILSQLQFGSSGYKAVVYQGIAEGFPTVKIENLKIYQDVEDGPSPACALISVKEATLEDRKIKFKTLLDEECFLKNNCRNNGEGGVEELPLPVQVSLSNQGVSNCVLLVEFGSRLESESWDSDRHYAVCEAVLISQPGPFALGRRQDSSDGILAGSSLKSYGMNRNPRGKCLIINNSEFQDEAYNRPGAEFDEQALEALFEYLSFDMEIHPNLDSRDMRDLVRTTASENHSESDALFVIEMSHRGNHDIVLGVDQRNIAVEEMMSELNAARCKRLEGKPKVFIFQVCRGSSSEFLEHERRHIDDAVEEMMFEVNAARCKSLEGKRKVFIFQFCKGSSSEFLEHERRHLDNTGNKNAQV